MRIKVNGARLYFDVEGLGLVPDGPVMKERPTIVLLHGGPGSDHASYMPEMQVLAEQAQLIYLDHRGNGRSDPGTPDQWTVSQWADDVAGLLDALEIEKPYILAASVGGFIAQAFAVNHPDRVGKLALLASGPRSDLEMNVAIFTELGGERVGEIARGFLSGDMSFEAEYMKNCIPYYMVNPPTDTARFGRPIRRLEVLRHFFQAGGEWHTLDFRSQLSRITCPTLVLHGDRDPIIPLALARELQASIPNDLATLSIIENAGHGWMDKPDEWLSQIKHFFFD